MRCKIKGKFLASLFLLNFMVVSILNAQWVQTYGESEDDHANAIQQTRDGGFIVAGFTNSFGAGSSDVWILKLATDGSIEWQKTYGENSLDEAWSVQQTLDGGYIVAARSQSFSGSSSNFWILKLAGDGSLEWQKSYGGTDADDPYSIQQTTDGGYIVAGHTTFDNARFTDFWVLKLSSDGNIEWQKTYGESLRERAYCIQQTLDGGYIVAGTTESFGAGSLDIWILKIAFDGNIEWQKTYGESYGESLSSILQTVDGGYIVAGSASFFGTGQYDFWIFKLSSDGDIEWNKIYGGSLVDRPNSIQQTFDGGYIVAGTTVSFGSGSSDIWVLKLNALGELEWQKTYGGKQAEYTSQIQEILGGGYVIAGSTSSYGIGARDILILKLFPNGDVHPSCIFINDSNAEVTDINIPPADTHIDAVSQNFLPVDTNVLTPDSEAVVYSLCLGQHTLTLTKSDGGITDPQPGIFVYDHAERARLEAEPDKGFIFLGWSGDIFGINRTIITTMDSDKSAKANFTKDDIEEIWEEAKKSPCFIATAAFGSPLHPYVVTLQDFRDRYLMSNQMGRKFVLLYYKYSPPIAKLISNNKVIKTVVRFWLIPLVVVGYSMVHLGPVQTIAVFLLGLMPLFVPIWIKRKRRKTELNKLV